MTKYLHTMIRVTDPEATIRFFERIGQHRLRDSGAAEDDHVAFGDNGRWDMAATPQPHPGLFSSKGDEVENSDELLLHRHGRHVACV